MKDNNQLTVTSISQLSGQHPGNDPDSMVRYFPSSFVDYPFFFHFPIVHWLSFIDYPFHCPISRLLSFPMWGETPWRRSLNKQTIQGLLIHILIHKKTNKNQIFHILQETVWNWIRKYLKFQGTVCQEEHDGKAFNKQVAVAKIENISPLFDF